MPTFNNPLARQNYRFLTSSISLRARDTPPTVLGELVLNISDKCNLRCKYCFADGGKYGAAERLMTVETAKRAIDEVLSKYAGIGSIKFFGGEPLLNLQLLEDVCTYLESLTRSGSFTMPKLNIVTNFTLGSAKAIGLLISHGFGVTVSVDGPRHIHDPLRPFANGAGSYDLIFRNIRRFRDAVPNKERIGIEAVYTPLHLQHDISLIELHRSLRRELGITCIIIHPLVENIWSSSFFAGISESCRAAYYDGMRRNSYEYGKFLVDETARGEKIGTIYSMLNAATSSVLPDTYCGLGVGTLSVMADGSIYPCYMFANEADFRMGNVLDDEPFSARFKDVQSYFLGRQKTVNQHCQHCDIQDTCSSCQGSMFGKWRDVTRPVPLLCDYYIGLREGLAERLGEIAADRPQWNALVGSLRDITRMVLPAS